jgi:hypothetical protein
MTHMYIPTTPPPTRYQPRHRRNVQPDDAPVARCSGYGIKSPSIFCQDAFCPRHDATAYASHMGRHATDTI